jgi:ABC-2 type transport system permease protein
MDKTLRVALQEFKTNLARREYKFFAFVLPVGMVILSLVFASGGRQFSLFEFQVMQGKFEFFAFPSVIAMVFSLAIFLSANFMLQGIAKEKENKILEILISSVSFKQLLTGKILGLAALGLIQFFAWIAAGMVVVSTLAPEIFAKAMGSLFATQAIILYFLFFILGYLLYASLLAAIGILTETRGEAQQIGSLLTGFALIPALSTMFLTSNSSSLYARAITFFPLTAPITAMIRIFLRAIPPEEIGLSLVILGLSTVAVIFATARLFRAETLMYGKKFSVKSLVRFVLKG